MPDDKQEYDAWYDRGEELGLESIKVLVGSLWGAGDEGRCVSLDIRDAVYFRYLLDGAINDYEKAVGR